MNDEERTRVKEMDKLYSRKSRFDDVLAGRYSLPVMFMLVGIFVILPWDDWGRISWYASVMEYQEAVFPNLQKLDKELPPNRAEFFKPMVAFMNIVGWPLLFYVLTRAPIADKIVTGEKSARSAVMLLVFVSIGCAFTPWILVASGTQGGMLTRITRATDFGLTMILVFTWWGAILLWYILLTVIFGLFKKRVCE